MSDFPRRAPARKRKEILDIARRVDPIELQSDRSDVEDDSACLQDSGNERSRNDRRHYHRKWGKKRETEAADRDERRLKL